MAASISSSKAGIKAKFPTDILLPISHFPEGAPAQVYYGRMPYFFTGTNGNFHGFSRTRIRSVLSPAPNPVNPDSVKHERLSRLKSIGIDPTNPDFKLNVLPPACYGALYAAEHNYPQEMFNKLWAECLAGL